MRNVNNVNWNELRNEYFNECVNLPLYGSVTTPRVNMHPHTLFEWFKRKLKKRERVVEGELITYVGYTPSDKNKLEIMVYGEQNYITNNIKAGTKLEIKIIE